MIHIREGFEIEVFEFRVINNLINFLLNIFSDLLYTFYKEKQDEMKEIRREGWREGNRGKENKENLSEIGKLELSHYL